MLAALAFRHSVSRLPRITGLVTVRVSASLRWLSCCRSGSAHSRPFVFAESPTGHACQRCPVRLEEPPGEARVQPVTLAPVVELEHDGVSRLRDEDTSAD